MVCRVSLAHALKRSQFDMATAAQIAANRRNAQKSTGPRIEAGKNRSKFNAVVHGMRSTALVFPDDDPRALQDELEAWTAELQPRNPSEQTFIEDFVMYSWRLARVELAQTARLTANISNAGVAEAIREREEALELASRLFADALEAQALACDNPAAGRRSDSPATQSTIGPDQPARLVLHLRSTLTGCQWMLEQWAALKEILRQRGTWLESDRFKAIRLLGKDKDVFVDREVEAVFRACARPAPNRARQSRGSRAR
jgi:hypothetical protein